MSVVDDLEIMFSIARDAASVVAHVYATNFAVDYKGPGDPVTRADREANALICSRLTAAFPGVPIVAEESDESSYAGWSGAERVFFVDPLDGTREFVARNGEFAVMIGLAERGRAKAGVVLSPASSTAWAGALGKGAWRTNGQGEREPLRVTGTKTLAQARLVVSRSHRGEALSRVIGHLGLREVAPYGSAGLKAAQVAEGRADLYLQLGRAGKRWDACAAEAIVLAAGGRFTDQMGDPIDYADGRLDNDRGLAASKGVLHAEMLSAVARDRGA